MELLEEIDFEFLPTANAIGKARRTIWNGREYIVAPITSIVPGILNGSKGALYYPPDEIGANPEAWNGVPLTVYHPTRNGYHVSARDPEILESQGIGTVYGSTFNGALRHEGWFDVALTAQADKRYGTDILKRLNANQPIEMSTGLFTDNEPAQNGATWKGREYEYIARNYRPDHIAVLPGEVGACSVNDGCGVMVNRLADDKKCDTGKWGKGRAAVAVNRIEDVLQALIDNAEDEEECECGGTCENCKAKMAANAASPAECFITLLHAATSAHILHLQTRSFAAHSALDSLYKELPGLTDDLIEAWQGIHGIVEEYPSGFKPSTKEPAAFVREISDYVKDNRDALGSESEIQNIVDEIAGMLDGTAYKLRFLS